ncbi:ORF103L [Infectious spleen and kidney necrosis virus]|uniref:ORF103L n=1 Tax=Infectious spleen and kidney necrosis virus TaxID=180170 RepID=A0A140G0V4_ISKNV|nr:ORF103L [Infectious spleen and kidney necrosis virus]
MSCAARPSSKRRHPRAEGPRTPLGPWSTTCACGTSTHLCARPRTTCWRVRPMWPKSTWPSVLRFRSWGTRRTVTITCRCSKSAWGLQSTQTHCLHTWA